MSISLARYYKRQKVVLQCETVTPLFLGNAQQEAEWRAAPFKGLLRYWWRVTQHDQPNKNSLFQKESVFFGSAGDNDDKSESKSGKSLVEVLVKSDSGPRRRGEKVVNQSLTLVNHPEKGQVGPLLYLAGMGLMRGENTIHSFFPERSTFRLTLNYPEKNEAEIKPILALVQSFGVVGGRCRNGWGSFQVVSGGLKEIEAIPFLETQTKEWKIGMMKDYPSCLGTDSKGILLWRTVSKDTWYEAMRELSVAYIAVRAGVVGSDRKLDPGKNNQAGERHLLGVPLSHHNAWGQSARHASPLRFIVRMKRGNFQGYILHLPFGFSEKMVLPNSIDQIKVWEKVHRKLDGLLHRATYEECL